MLRGLLGQPIDMPSTTELISECWQNAEQAAIDEIGKKHWDPDEEFVTKLLCGELRHTLRNAVESKRVAQAFFKDVVRRFPAIEEYALKGAANKLVATVTLHKRHIERLTGGDLGLVIVRPSVTHRYDSFVTFGDYRRGLLIQAKMRRRDGKWGSLTAKQTRLFPKVKDYYGLLLYSFQDQDRRILNPPAWQLCKDGTTMSVRSWLIKSRFPELLDSRIVIRRLSAGKIGTSNKTVIDEMVSPNINSSIEVVVFWPDDGPPPPGVPITVQDSPVEQVVLYRR
jgi:hypothetical protein